MMKQLHNLAILVCLLLLSDQLLAQSINIGGPFGAQLIPSQATSADTLRISMSDTTCGGNSPYVSNPYRVQMQANSIVVTLGEKRINPITPLCPFSPAEEFEIGRLPAGTYTLTLISEAVPGSPSTLVSNAQFTVTDARPAKSAPYVRLDYSGHWWDTNDSGWGLFVWHDAKDNVLAAWFTYGADGKPIWWVFQPRWQTATATTSVPLVQTSRAPGPTSPPPNPTTSVQVGTASLDFSRLGSDLSESGKITYQVGAGPTLTRNIVRFKP